MSESIRVLYIGGSTTDARSAPLADDESFELLSVGSVSEARARLSTTAVDCLIVSPGMIAEIDESAMAALWEAAACPCLLAPPRNEPPVVGERTQSVTNTAASGDHAASLAAQIQAAVDTPQQTADTGSMTAETEHTERAAGSRSRAIGGVDHTDTTEPAYRSLIEDGLSISSVGTFVLDSDFSVVWLNDGIEEYFGVDRAAILGRDKRALITNRLKEIFAEPERFAETVCATYDDNTYVEQFTCHVVGDDTRAERWLEHSSYPIPDGPYAGGRIEHYVDITDHRETQQQLEAQNDRLAEFASIASHDLRNPLHVMGSSLELAAETGDAEHFERAERAVDRMEQLIDDLLVLAKQGEGIDERETVALEAVARHCWDNLSTETATLKIETSRTLTADRSRLIQLLENLFSNSITHGGATVELTVGTCEGGFFVADNGPGVPPDDRGNIFERGYTTTREGTGLGLYIVNEIAAAHGWAVTLTDSAENGARIEITGVDDAADSGGTG